MRLLFLFLISLNTNLFSQENKKIIDDFINEGIELWGIPGMSVVAVNDTSTLFKKSYGKRNYFSDELVNSETIFSMASTTKAFIAMGLGILVDRDSIKWDDN